MIQEITVRQLKARMEAGENLKLVDVRSASEYASGHIPGTINYPLENVEKTLPEATVDDQVVVICQEGGRSMMACQKVERTYPFLFNLAGGTGAWIDAGFPVE